MSTGSSLRPGWILGPRQDLLIFTGPLILGLGIIAAVAAGPGLDSGLSPWAFAVLIVGCDVSHVYATAYRVYMDPERMQQRRTLFLGVPLACFGVGVVLYGSSATLFWRTLAYLAAFHFVRQQWGWMAYSRRAAGEQGKDDQLIDQIAIYNATLFPLLFWHANLPRAFHWFLPGDFAGGLASWAGDAGLLLHWSINGAYVLHQLRRWLTGKGVNIAKLHIWLTTWCAWYGGIVIFNSDWAFTALNVLAHGIPYLVVVNRVEALRRSGRSGFLASLFKPSRWPLYLGLLMVAGFTEEWLWDRLVWHEHGGLFPGLPMDPGEAGLVLLVPLLAMPQATHYVLDGWIWKLGSNPEVAHLLQAPRGRTGSESATGSETEPAAASAASAEGGTRTPTPKKGN